jgi:hypothetical protein
VKRRLAALALVAALLCGCGGGEDEDETVAEMPPVPSLPDEPRGGTVAVPDRDESPPQGVVSLEQAGRKLARAPEPGEAPRERVRVDRRRLSGRMVGADPESGAARVRVSVKESISCRLPSGRLIRRPKVRYFPPPQIQRVRSSPGARIPVMAMRTAPVTLGDGSCPQGAAVAAVSGELWGEVTNGIGLEAVTSHIRFEWREAGSGPLRVRSRP